MTTEEIQRAFEASLAADRSFIRPFMASWDYQVKRRKRGVSYQDELPQDFFRFGDPDEIVNWMNWFSGEYPDFIAPSFISPLEEQSLEYDRELLQKLGVAYDFDQYKNVGLNNAHDFFIPQSYPIPQEHAIRNVLDFGAGYGRQANLWWPFLEGKGNLIGVDAIPLSYSLQSHYYSAIKPGYKDYIFEKDGFRIAPEGSELYHLPTWRLDLVPDNSIDLIICIQVLPELGSKLINYLFDEFARILKPGGAFYIRDLNYLYKAFGSSTIDARLEKKGFRLEYRAYVGHNKHLHGIPRVWRKTVPEIEAANAIPAGLRKRYFLEYIDAVTGGRLKSKK
jgi:SAM-dependent methyltransferase